VADLFDFKRLCKNVAAGEAGIADSADFGRLSSKAYGRPDPADPERSSAGLPMLNPA
jgi:hypothetical protein